MVRLEAAEEFVQGLLRSGGRVNLVIHLPGHINVGDMISLADLPRMGRLVIGPGMEVFPDMR